MRPRRDGSTSRENELELEVPWEVAECLFAGREGKSLQIDLGELEDKGRFHLKLHGDRGSIDVEVD